MIRLYAFLGNHGREYHGNRHNVAWLFLESLPFYDELRWERKFKGRHAVRETPAGRTWILMPETFMNLSGDAVAELMRFHQIEPAEVLAVHDEIEMGFGLFGFKMGGGLGGHNGLRSLEARLGTRDFARLRIGVGRPEHPDIADYVLSNFTKAERELLETSVFPKAATALELCFAEGFETALAKYPKIRALD
ncbi:MAG TPA: aminoacyl-tRNA hydrolase [Rectinemataceae bacterium]|nr:aminoacyl-tRNA hydrolase [Rectinemataceae bacterium]